jgi:predicted nicotinamide N-methyase
LNSEAHTAFIRSKTAVGTPALVPEIKLHLATEVAPLWRATQTTFDKDNLPPPYWAFAWPGGQALARYVLDHPDIVRGRRVLDFASGSGLVALAAARAGAAQVTASDIDPFAAAAIAMNAALNNTPITISTADPIDGPPAGGPRWGLVLAGDVCYEQPLAERAVRWLRSLVDHGIDVLLADPGRAYRPRDGVWELARYAVPTLLELEDCTERITVVWRITE